jgi:two-component system response regulator FixJ
MRPSPPVVALVDHDPAMLPALCPVVEGLGYRVVTFRSGLEFLAQPPADPPDCLLLHLEPPERGLELQRRLAAMDSAPPVVFVARHVDLRTAVRAVRAGALDVLCEPLGEQELRVRCSNSWRRAAPTSKLPPRSAAPSRP